MRQIYEFTTDATAGTASTRQKISEGLRFWYIRSATGTLTLTFTNEDGASSIQADAGQSGEEKNPSHFTVKSTIASDAVVLYMSDTPIFDIPGRVGTGGVLAARVYSRATLATGASIVNVLAAATGTLSLCVNTTTFVRAVISLEALAPGPVLISPNAGAANGVYLYPGQSMEIFTAAVAGGSWSAVAYNPNGVAVNVSAYSEFFV